MCGCLSRAPTGDLACNPGMCPDREPNQQPLALQVSTQSTEPHQPGPVLKIFNYNILKPLLQVLEVPQQPCFYSGMLLVPTSEKVDVSSSDVSPEPALFCLASVHTDHWLDTFISPQLMFEDVITTARHLSHSLAQ